ncbi:MAG: hypothetical protein M1812_005842 [Candelaria pacifica]|nr:MAG: hypothetical protein M1812_005842 [Candelaria pacifica]
MKETAEAFGQQRKRKIPSSFVGGDPNKPQRKILRQSGQLDDRIRSLESEIQALKGENRSLKSENEALKRKVLKKHACQICKKSYSRSDGLYKHLWEGDDDHKALAQERYGTRCGSCKTDFKSWVSLQRHTISRHGQDALRSADDLIGLESDETPTSPNPSTKISKAEGHTSSATSL